MKKTKRNGKLLLTTEKVRDLTPDRMEHVAGGTSLVYQPIVIQQTPLASLQQSIVSAGVTHASGASKEGYSG